VLNRVEVDYRTPLHLGERFTSCLNVAREGARFVFLQDIYNEQGKIVVSGKVSCVVTINGRLTRGDELAKYFEAYL
jgi:acyl-CoA thioester hydrolase